MTDSQLRLLKGTFDVLILKTLSWGPAHGYAVSRWLRHCSDNELRIEEGALYPALRRLEERGWIESEWRTAESGREARVYSLTRAGQQALQSEVSAWRRYMKVFTRVLEARPDESLA
ncbi:MAG TPA: PadR family transcriptional regulator [Gemmatimonadales bacterium]|jgi:transcriptional regulator|nr:PadR family transcriptional regulator [Gemmatimonadales bacterium]